MKIIKYILSAVLCLAMCEAKAQVYETVELKNGVVYNGYISEQDFNRGTMKFVNENGTEIAGIKMQEIVSITKKKRVGNYDSGLLEIVYHDSIISSGQIVSIIPGKEYIVIKEDGNSDTIPSKNLKKVDKKSLYADRNIFEQSPFLETITISKRLKNGKTETTTYNGIITTQSYNKYTEESVIRTKEGKEEKFSMSDASIYKKSLNPDYKKMPQYSLRAADEMCIYAGTDKYERTLNINIGEKIPEAYPIVEVNDSNFVIVCHNTVSEEIYLVPIISKKEIIPAKKKKEKPVEIPYEIIDQASVTKAMGYNECRKGNGFTVYFFKGIPSGRYVAYYKKAKKGVLIEIKQSTNI